MHPGVRGRSGHAGRLRCHQPRGAAGAPSLALRVDLGGVSFGYSGDTQRTPALTAAADGTDLFAAEAYTFARPIRHHLDYATLRAHLAEIPARQAMLTHMSADMLSRLAEADLPAACDGRTIRL